jgi:hypothetical protein
MIWYKQYIWYILLSIRFGIEMAKSQIHQHAVFGQTAHDFGVKASPVT